jgi:hypothetical protein
MFLFHCDADARKSFQQVFFLILCVFTRSLAQEVYTHQILLQEFQGSKGCSKSWPKCFDCGSVPVGNSN